MLRPLAASLQRPGGSGLIRAQSRSRPVRASNVVTAPNTNTCSAYYELVELINAAQCMGPNASEAAHTRSMEMGQLLDDTFDVLDSTMFFSKQGFCIPKAEKALIDASGGSSAYGELTSEGVEELVSCLEPMCPDAVFCDLGSGRGRALLHVAMRCPHLKECIGLELSKSRLDQADMALGAMQELGMPMAPVTLKEADLSVADLSRGTHFYLCSTAFGAGLCRSIAKRLAASQNFQVLVTSRALPVQPYLQRLGEIPLQYTFTAAGCGYVYVKCPSLAPRSLVAKFRCRDGVCWLPGYRAPVLAVAVEEPVIACSGIQLPLSVPYGSSSGGSASRGPSAAQ